MCTFRPKVLQWKSELHDVDLGAVHCSHYNTSGIRIGFVLLLGISYVQGVLGMQTCLQTVFFDQRGTVTIPVSRAFYFIF